MLNYEPQVDGGYVVLRHKEQTLEYTAKGLVVSDGWLTDWIIIYPHNRQWAQDGVLDFYDEIKEGIERICEDDDLFNLFCRED